MGAFCSPPLPSESAIGSMPMIIAGAVIQTGRSRVAPATLSPEQLQDRFGFITAAPAAVPLRDVYFRHVSRLDDEQGRRCDKIMSSKRHHCRSFIALVITFLILRVCDFIGL
jgi:hypothetical protein